MAELLGAVAQAIRQDELCAVVTVLSGDAIGRKMLVRRERMADRDAPTVATTGSLGDEALEQAATSLAADAMEARRTTRITLPAKDQDWDLLIDVHVPQERLIIVGAVHIAIPLVSFARELGLYTVVIDARPIFATQDRFGHVDELIRSWPDEALQEMKLNESSYVVTLTHDEKLDTPALICALDHPVGYIGALGSKRTHAKRVTALREAGVSDEQISRIHAPIGLDLGGRSPGEIALAIMAEIVQVRNHVLEAGR
ncbi:MAG: XdhC family protein [Caldilineaceae bacterium]|nr:XdhC family protein [Caldilineaceae bacterium]